MAQNASLDGAENVELLIPQNTDVRIDLAKRKINTISFAKSITKCSITKCSFLLALRRASERKPFWRRLNSPEQLTVGIKLHSLTIDYSSIIVDPCSAKGHEIHIAFDMRPIS
jgi:hypothetical protein